MGRLGGHATASKLTAEQRSAKALNATSALSPEQRSANAQHAVRTRWKRYYERNPDRRPRQKAKSRAEAPPLAAAR
jgi:hypothetical protein